jgi:N-methylhydantoinase A
VELVRLIVTATATDTAELPPLRLDARGHAGATDAPGERTAEVHFGDGFTATTVIPRSALAGGESRPGPLIVESMDTTVVVPPGWTVSSDPVGILELWRDGTGPRHEAATTVAVTR